MTHSGLKNIEKKVIQDVLKRPLDTLMPIQDLAYFLEPKSLDISVSIEEELSGIVGNSAWNDLKPRLQESRTADRIIEDFATLDIDIELDFKQLTIGDGEIKGDLAPLKMLKTDSEIFKACKYVQKTPPAQTSPPTVPTKARSETVETNVLKPQNQNIQTYTSGTSWGQIKQALTLNDPANAGKAPTTVPPDVKTPLIPNPHKPVLPEARAGTPEKQAGTPTTGDTLEIRYAVSSAQGSAPPMGTSTAASQMFVSEDDSQSSSSHISQIIHPQTAKRPVNEKRPANDNSAPAKKQKLSHVENLHEDFDPLRHYQGNNDISVEYLYNCDLFINRSKASGDLGGTEVSDLKAIELGCLNVLNDLVNSMSGLNGDVSEVNCVEKGVHVCHICCTIVSCGHKTLVFDEMVGGIVKFVVSVLKLSKKLGTAPTNNDSLLSEVRNWTIDTLKTWTDLSRHTTVSIGQIGWLVVELLEFLSPATAINAKSPLQGIAIACSECLVSVYGEFPGERESILHEIIAHIGNMRPSKLEPRLIVLKQGQISVLVHTMLQFIQSIHVRGLEAEYYASNGDVGALEAKLVAEIAKNHHTVANIVEVLANAYVQGNRNGLEVLVDDLATALPLMQYSGTVVMVLVLINKLFGLLRQELPPPAETGLLGLCGTLCLTIYAVVPAPDPPLPDLRQLVDDTLQISGFMFSHGKGHVIWELGRCHVITTTLQYLITKLSPQGSENSAGPPPDPLAGTETLTGILTDGVPALMAQLWDKTAIQKVEDATGPYCRSFLGPLHAKAAALVYVIVQGLQSRRTKTRAKCVRLVSEIVAHNSRLLASPQVHPVIATMAGDDSPLVRDAMLDLVSKYVESRPDSVDQFYAAVTCCLADASIQVRKRAVGILKNMYYATASVDARAHIVAKLLARVGTDDDTVVKLVCNTVAEFMVPPASADHRPQAAMVQVFVAALATYGAADNLQAFLERVLDQLGDFAAKFANYCAILVEMLVKQAVTAGRPDPAALGFVAVLVRARGSLFPRHYLRALNVFLTTNDHCHPILEILRHVLPAAPALLAAYNTETVDIITSHMGTYSLKAVAMAIPCVVELSRRLNSYDKLGNTVRNTLKILYNPYILQLQQHQYTSDPKLLKVLRMLGLFGSLCRLDTVSGMFVDFGLGESESVVSLLLRSVLRFCDPNFDERTRNAALKSVLLICSAHPKLFYSLVILDILDREMNLRSEATRKTLVHGIYGALTKVEADSDKDGSAPNPNPGLGGAPSTALGGVVLNGTTQADDDFYACTTVVQRYMPHITRFALCDEGPVGLAVVQYLDAAVRWGYTGPVAVIATAMALAASANPQIRATARQLHAYLFNKHQSLCDLGYDEGIRCAVTYRLNVAGTLSSTTTFLQAVYAVVSPSYSSRKKLVAVAARHLRVDLSDKVSYQQAFVERDTVMFVAANLAHVDFCTTEEVLLVIAAVNKTLRRQGLDVYDMINDEVGDKRLLCVWCNAFAALLRLKAVLVAKYGISDAQIDGFRPDKPDVDIRGAAKVYADVTYESNVGDIVDAASSGAKINELLAKFVADMHDYS